MPPPNSTPYLASSLQQQGCEVFIGVGSGQMISLQENTIENSTAPQAVQVIEDGQIQTLVASLVASGPAAMGAAIHGPQIPRGRDPIVFVPVKASTGGDHPHSPPHLNVTPSSPKRQPG
jgi:hypothetical protein